MVDERKKGLRIKVSDVSDCIYTAEREGKRKGGKGKERGREREIERERVRYLVLERLVGLEAEDDVCLAVGAWKPLHLPGRGGSDGVRDGDGDGDSDSDGDGDVGQ